MTVRTRFAPSPTGTLHLGNVRTAIFAWAYARRHGGQFILRVEDTDQERSSEAAAHGIIRDMKWLGLDYDEGPYFQMQRLERYHAVIAQLLSEGKAYHCYMSEAELDALREAQKAKGENPKYDGRWRPENLAPGTKPPEGVQPVVRFKTPLEGSVTWDDGVKGRIEIQNSEMDDLVIARPDGTPVYNFCVVVDDIDMRISHVIRGDGHVMNTPRQIHIFNALGVAPPVFAHLPTVLGNDGEKLSKRHGAKGLVEYAEEGFLPSGLINGLARLGFSHGNDEVFSVAQLVEWFALENLNSAPARFDAQKFEWFNSEHIKRLPLAELGQALAPFLPAGAGLEKATAIAELLRDRAPTLKQIAAQANYFFDRVEASGELKATHLTPAALDLLAQAKQALSDLDTWDKASITACLKVVMAKAGVKPPALFMPMRVLLAGTTTTPGVDAILSILGKEESLARI